MDPTFTVPSDVTVFLDINCQLDTTAADIGNVGDAADGCSAGLTATYVDDLSGLTGCNNTGTFTRTWTVTDDCLNSTVQVQTVTVEDIINPTFTVPADLTVFLDVNCQLDTCLLYTSDAADE